MAGQKLLPVLLTLALVACGKADDDRAGPVGDDGGVPPSGAYSLFDPTAGTVPFPSDFLFNGTTDGTLNIPNASGAPFVTAANELDGFSTTASLFTDFIGHVDVENALEGVLIIDTSTSTPLTPGVDYRLQSSTAIDPATGAPLNQLRTRLLIEPLKPFKPSTLYLVVVTRQVMSVDGLPVEAADVFRVVRSTQTVEAQLAAGTEPVLTKMDAAKRGLLETIRQQFVQREVFEKLALAGIARENVVIAWPFTTQSTVLTLQQMAAEAVPSAITALKVPLKTEDVLQNPQATGGDIYGGSISLPYYLGMPANANDRTPLTAFWQADHDKPNAAAVIPAVGVACSSLPVKSASTTACYPLPKLPKLPTDPEQDAYQAVPVLITVPNADSGQAMPGTGWPVVIFQHGITRDRSDMLALAPALSRAGFAVVAIDLPLHGVTDTTSLLRSPLVPERTFDLDLVSSASGASEPDGIIDDSGTHFVNLASLLTSRDNIRQAAADLLVLAKSVGNATLLLPGAPPTSAGVQLDGSKVHFVGHSLGGIVGTPFLAVSGDVRTGALAMSGGGIAKLLDGSSSFGPRIAAGLEASSVGAIVEGNDNYETFLRFAQTVIDSGDPLNFAAMAAAEHPILMYTVQADAVVPNCTIKDDPLCPATDTLILSGYLSGSYPLARTLGLEFKNGEGSTAEDVLTPPLATSCDLNTEGHRKLLRYGAGDHSSILSPNASPEVTQEMQRTLAVFLASDGAMLQMGNGNCAN